MPIPVRCPECGAEYPATDELAGKSIRCPRCRAMMQVPANAPRFLERAPALSRNDESYQSALPLQTGHPDAKPGNDVVVLRQPGAAPRAFRNLYAALLPLTVLSMLMLVGVGAVAALIAARFIDRRADAANMALILLLLVGVALVLAVAALVVFCVLIYKAWALIQDEHASLSPGLAAGLMAVPFVNVFWSFSPCAA